MQMLLPLVGIFLNSLAEPSGANSLASRLVVVKPQEPGFYSANCIVGNTTYVHGRTFKLDCKTQCVCENGRHACSSLCPKEQLPAPEDTISCKSPRLVEVPGHCCRMWLCENPTADVVATCQNSSSSPWTACSRRCGIGISTRLTSTTRGCRKLSQVRLCENSACSQDIEHEFERSLKTFNEVINKKVSLKTDGSHRTSKNVEQQQHRIRKGHECRHNQRLGPARIRLGPCVSKKLYRPKLCGRCQNPTVKCCVPSVSTTIQVEMLCPLAAGDPISYVQQAHRNPSPARLWNTSALEPIDQEFLQSHQIQIENKFIAVEWILKCECSRHERCNNVASGDNLNNNNYHKNTYHNAYEPKRYS